VLLPGALAYVARYFQANPHVDAVYGHRYVIDEADRLIGTWLLPPHDDALLPWIDYVPQETLFWRRRVWERAGGRMDESFGFALDWDLLLRFRAAGARMVRLPRFLGAFRMTADNKTSTQLDSAGRREIDRLRERWLGFVPTDADVARRARGYLRRHVLCRALHRAGVFRY
jgi:hypothetical protein